LLPYIGDPHKLPHSAEPIDTLPIIGLNPPGFSPLGPSPCRGSQRFFFQRARAAQILGSGETQGRAVDRAALKPREPPNSTAV